MNWSKLGQSFLFSFLVTAATNALDMTYHIAVGTAVHLHYVAIKFTVLFLTIFLVDLWVGRETKDAVFSSIAGPLVFYFYYVRATPTLDRSVFVLDEAFGYFFVHATAMYASYLLVTKMYDGCDEWFDVKKWILLIAGIVFTLVPYAALKSIGLHLELGQANLALVGILLFFGSMSLFIDNKKYIVPAITAGLFFIFLDMAYRMSIQNLTETMSSVPSLAILSYVIPHAIIVMISAYALGSHDLAKNAGWAVLTGALLAWHGVIAGFGTNIVIDGVFYVIAFFLSHFASRGKV